MENSSKEKKKYHHICQLNNGVDVYIVDIYVKEEKNIFMPLGMIFIYMNNESEMSNIMLDENGNILHAINSIDKDLMERIGLSDVIERYE